MYAVSWEDIQIYEAKIENGNVLLFDQYYKLFTAISMSESNAVIIPALIKTLYDEFLHRQQN
jgi:hypothetical protein